MKKCAVCGKEFDGKYRNVCSWQCDEKRLQMLAKRLNDAVKKDMGHTKKLSENGDKTQ